MPSQGLSHTEPVLVTGGAGFIGVATVRRLLDRGARVRVLDNLSTGRRCRLPAADALEFIQGDIRDPAAVAHAMRGVGVVLHLAAQVSVPASLSSPGRSAEHNIQGFVQVLHAAQQAGVRRLVYGSSAAVYGVPAQLPLCETAATQALSPYGLEKLVNEQYARLYQQLYGFPTLGLRYFNVYGPGQDAASPYAGVVARFLAAVQQGEPLTVRGSGEQSRDFIHVDDIAELNCLALAGKFTGVVNAGSGIATSIQQLVATLGQLHGRPLPVCRQPEVLGDIPSSYADTRLMWQVFGRLQPQTLEQGLAPLLVQLPTLA